MMQRQSALFPSLDKNIEIFDEFFASEMDETISPFLTPKSRKSGKNLGLKATFLGALFLAIAFLLTSFYPNHPLIALSLLFSYFFAGTQALIDAIEDLLNLEINIDILMTLSAFLATLIGSSKEGALLLVLFALSGAIDERVRKKANHNLRELKSLAPTRAYVLDEKNQPLLTSVRAIKPGDRIYVRAGEIVPLDGTVLEGKSTLNVSHLTGESYPISIIPSSKVYSGSTNIEGPLTITVSHTASDSTISRIIHLVTEARENKPKFQSFIDRFSSLYAKGVILFTLLFALTAPFFLQIEYLGNKGSFYRAIAVLIAASPCALVIAIPITYLSAIGACAKKGILLKGGNVLDALVKCRLFAFDKTGTLTEGKLKVIEMIALDPKSDKTLAFQLAYSLERGAHHPIAEAIWQDAEKKDISLLPLKEHKVISGAGVQAIYQQKELFIGNRQWILPKIPADLRSTVETKIKQIEERGLIFTLFLLSNEVFIFVFEDVIRDKIPETLKLLKERFRLKLVMLTGDHERSARRIAERTGFNHYLANLKPEQKLKEISRLAKEGDLAMVGDGINDAPSLARANVGIAMGGAGAQSAIDASDIVLLQDKVDQLGWLMAKGHTTLRVVRQNIILSFVAIICASTAALAGTIPLWLAVILHEGSTVIVAMNALRLLKK